MLPCSRLLNSWVLFTFFAEGRAILTTKAARYYDVVRGDRNPRSFQQISLSDYWIYKRYKNKLIYLSISVSARKDDRLSTKFLSLTEVA